MKKSFLIILLVFLISCSAEIQNQEQLKETEVELTVMRVLKNIQEGGYHVIDTESFKYMYDNDDLVLICAMPPMEGIYSYEIPGSIRYPVPMDSLEMIKIMEDETKQQEFNGILGPQRDRPVVFYCGRINPGFMSHNAAMWARKLGYTNVFRYIGGIKAWIESGYPYLVREVPVGVIRMLKEKMNKN